MKSEDEVSQFLNNQKALIVEPSMAFFSVIQSCLTGFGMSNENIYSANSYKDAAKILNDLKPKIIITEYTIGKHFGLALIEKHGEIYDSTSRISIMVTKESSDNAVAEAAEEQLDAYIVKPFSMMDLKNRVLEVVKRKMHPTPYYEKIREGKALLKIGNMPEAVSIFSEAKQLNTKPTLAHYYLGDYYLQSNEIKKALLEFEQGRKFNNLHYKCLTGEFDCQMLEKNYQKAYELVKLIRQNYPVTSARLGKFFIAAVYTESFQDLPQLYELYLNLDIRPPELVNLVSIALLTAGKHYLRQKNNALALEYFEMTTSVTAKSLVWLEKIIDELLKVNDVTSAEKFLKYSRGGDTESAKYHVINFKVGRYILPVSKSLEMGRKLVIEDKAPSEVVRTVVQMAIENKKLTLAESMIIKGAEKFPDLRKELYEMLEAVDGSDSED
ncbi:MAG: response regulator [Bdellovibrionales bacterium]|nr:response regulator [Bdellovibrionales bacterium]